MRILLLFALLVTMIACSEQGDCSDFSSNVMQAGFYSYSDKKVKTILIDSIKMADWDTVMYKNQSITKVDLPINSATNTMTYFFYYESKVATLEITYVVRAYSLAPDCKAIDIIAIKEAKGTVIEEFKISQPNLASDVIENIKLYF